MMKTYIFKPAVTEVEEPKCLVARALVFDVTHPIFVNYSDSYLDTINYVIEQFPQLELCNEDEMYEIIFSSSSKSSPFKCRTHIKVPANHAFIEELFKQLKNENTTDDPFKWSLKHNYDLFAKPKAPPKPKPRISKKESDIPPIDPLTVPEHLRFICSDAFKDQASEFYERLSYISPTSDREWVQKYFVDKLEDWPHIKRADDAIGGLLSQALERVAKHPHFPPWWRSVGVCMLRGNPLNLIESCKYVIEYKGEIDKPRDYSY